MVAAFEQRELGLGIARHHLAPVEYFVAFGNDGQLTRCGRLVSHVKRTQLIDELRREVEMLCRVVPTGLVANVVCQVARRWPC